MAIASVTCKIGDNTVTLTYNESTGKYEGKLAVPSKSSYPQTDHKYGATFTATTDGSAQTVTLDRTDGALGDACTVRVYEKVAPTVTITYPGAGAYLSTGAPTFKVSVSDNDSGVASVAWKIDGSDAASNLDITSSNGVYSATPKTVLSDGSHKLEVTATDNDGNTSTAVSVSFTPDTVDPTLNVDSAETVYTAKGSITLTGTTNDATSGLKSLTYSVDGTNKGEVTVGSDGKFSQTVTLGHVDTGEANVITFTVTDKADRTFSVTINVYVDTSIPVFNSVYITPNPASIGTDTELTIVADVTTTKVGIQS